MNLGTVSNRPTDADTTDADGCEDCTRNGGAGTCECDPDRLAPGDTLLCECGATADSDTFTSAGDGPALCAVCAESPDDPDPTDGCGPDYASDMEHNARALVEAYDQGDDFRAVVDAFREIIRRINVAPDPEPAGDGCGPIDYAAEAVELVRQANRILNGNASDRDLAIWLEESQDMIARIDADPNV